MNESNTSVTINPMDKISGEMNDNNGLSPHDTVTTAADGDKSAAAVRGRRVRKKRPNLHIRLLPPDSPISVEPTESAAYSTASSSTIANSSLMDTQTSKNNNSNCNIALPPPSLIPPGGGESERLELHDLQLEEVIGEGAFGIVTRHCHKPSGTQIAVKQLTLETLRDSRELSLRELNIIQMLTASQTQHESSSRERAIRSHLVHIYGVLLEEGGQVFIFMELMHCNLRDFYERVRVAGRGHVAIPNAHLALIGRSLLSALMYLKRHHSLMHRDVKPQNALAHADGRVALCDFGIAGVLTRSVAKSNVGTQDYLAPERILPQKCVSPNPLPPPASQTANQQQQQHQREPRDGYTIKADVFSLGLSLLELAMLRFPYRKWNLIFEQYEDVAREGARRPPTVIPQPLPPQPPVDVAQQQEYARQVERVHAEYSQLDSFVDRCMEQRESRRADYEELDAHAWLSDFARNYGGDVSGSGSGSDCAEHDSVFLARQHEFGAYLCAYLAPSQVQPPPLAIPDHSFAPSLDSSSPKPPQQTSSSSSLTTIEAATNHMSVDD